MEIEKLYKVYLNHPLISIDSRLIKKGGLFFALKGETFNGNQFAEKAIDNGAAYAIIDELKFKKDDRFILVDNVLKSLQKLANYHRKKLNIPILAITGTNGKTTTKELISCVLKKKFNLIYTQGNLNNHIGVPITLLSMKSDTAFGVVEMGANHQYEIKALCEIAEPNYGIITNIGKAHLEGFGSFETIIKTKCELYDFLNENNGLIFYNNENSILNEKVSTLLTKKISYGGADGNLLKGEVRESNPFIKVKIEQNDSKYEIATNIVGDYNLENILAAACVGNYFKISNEEIKLAIEEYKPSNNRSQFIKTASNSIYLDAYNANPTSIKASLLNFIGLEIVNKCLILGDMLELGNEAEKEHLEVVKLIEKHQFQKVILIGEVFSKIKSLNTFIKFSTVSHAIIWLEKNKIAHSNVLVKGSRGIQLELIVEYL